MHESPKTRHDGGGEREGGREGGVGERAGEAQLYEDSSLAGTRENKETGKQGITFRDSCATTTTTTSRTGLCCNVLCTSTESIVHAPCHNVLGMMDRVQGGVFMQCNKREGSSGQVNFSHPFLPSILLLGSESFFLTGVGRMICDRVRRRGTATHLVLWADNTLLCSPCPQAREG